MAYINAKGVELRATSTGSFAITKGANGVHTGSAKADVFNSVAGSTLKGGLGDDVYYLWDTSSKIIENANEGIDTVYVKAWSGYQLEDNVENAFLASNGGNWLTGNALNNVLVAGTMRATLDGGKGDDVLVGGAGADIFKITAGNGSDTIYNFKAGWDTVKLSGYGFTSFDQLKAAATQNGADVTIKLSSSESLVLRDVQLKDLGAADFGFAMQKLATPAGTTSYTTNQAYNANGWYVFTNAWGAQGLTANKDYTVNSVFSKSNMVKGTQFSWSFDTNTDTGQTIKAYPEVIFGISPLNSAGKNPTDTKMVLPVKVGDLVSLTADYDVSYGGNTGGFNVAYDIWLTSKAYGDKSTITNEIMVWVKKGDFEAYGTQVGTYTKGDFTAKIYHSGTYTALVSDKDVPAGTIDVVDILNTLKKLGYVSDSEYVASIELGAEVTQGQGQLTINDLNLTVASKTATGGTVTKTVTGTGTTVVETPAPGTGTGGIKHPAAGSESNAGSGSDANSGTKPVEPTKPTEPTKPAEPTKPVEPAKPVEPVAPTEPTYTASQKAAQAYYKVGTDKVVDANGITIGSQTTTATATTAKVVKTDAVGKSLGYDSATFGVDKTTVNHYDGAGKLLAIDVMTFATDGSITTNHYTAQGKAIDTIKEWKDSSGAQITEHYDKAYKFTGVDKAITDAKGGVTVQHYNAKYAFLGLEYIVKNADGSTTVQHYDKAYKFMGAEAISVANGQTTTQHYNTAWKFTGAEVATIDSATGVTKSVSYDAAWKATGETSFTGTDRVDTLVGSSGTTHFHGGLGADKMTGGSGVDYFHFDTSIAQGDIDVIANFNAATDKFVLSHDVFTQVGAVGDLDASMFVAGTKALDANDRVIFDKATGSLWYDDDGTGAHAPVLLATITGSGTITAANFMVD